MTIDELRDRLTIPLWPDTGQLLGISKNSVYRAAHNGEIETLRLGARILVPVVPLLKKLGIDPPAERPVELLHEQP